MNDEVECPYCEANVLIDHDDGFGYEEDKNHELQCHECEKKFIFTTSILYLFSSKKADCLNDIEHNYVLSQANPRKFSKMRCTMCRGERGLTDNEMQDLLDKENNP